ncbi:hypothetical protein [Roseobacter sp. S98]|uniref:hypothetical protein n=1 Tax=Roseobacter algicola (ex Choi et al. 2025) (nom. illeg.) TaxID=3092138 RepID=UPI003F51A848
MVLAFGPAPSEAEPLNAGFVALDMDPGDRFSFVSGIVQGLAFVQQRADQGSSDGTTCIYSWFYEEDGTMDTIMAAFAKFEDRDPAAVLSALIQRRCGV